MLSNGSTFGFSSFILLCLTFLCWPPASLSQIARWDTIQTEKQYLAALSRADVLTFRLEFEYPFLQILDERQKRHYLNLKSMESRKSFIHLYWKISNPNPIRTEYEWLEEFIQRVRDSKEMFSSYHPPYFDDRGKYYLRYGPPTSRFEDPGGSKQIDFHVINLLSEFYGSSLAPNYSVPANETWSYSQIDREFIVYFAKQKDGYFEIPGLASLLREGQNRDVAWQWYDLVSERSAVLPLFAQPLRNVEKLLDRLVRVRDSLAVAENFRDPDRDRALRVFVENQTGKDLSSGQPTRERLVSPSMMFNERQKQLEPHNVVITERDKVEFLETAARSDLPPATYVPARTISMLDLDYEILQFRRAEGATKLDVVVAFSVDDVFMSQGMGASNDSIEVRYTCLLRDRIFEPLVQVAVDRTFASRSSASGGPLSHLQSLFLFGPPGKAELTLQVENRTTNIAGFSKQSLSIRDFGGDSLMVSDVQFLTDSQEDPGKIERLDKTHMSAYPFKKISRSLPLYCYFEIYNLNSLGSSREFLTQLKVYRLEPGSNVINNIAQVFSTRDREVLSIESGQPITGESSQELMALDLSKLEQGTYRFEVRVSHPRNPEITASASKQFTLLE